MDLQALEYTRQHYNRHAGQYANTQEALQARAAGPGAPLKRFHNNIKRLLIQRFARGVPRLLDLCCGRGGDIWKWINADVQYVKGIDLSEGEIEEARSRLNEALQAREGVQLVADFVATPDLGIREWREEEQFDAVTCMFAIHYFFVSEKALKQFLHNVSINLRDGGYFIGTVPDGKRVNACVRHGSTYEAPMLHIQAHWQGMPQCFGSAYTCAIGDTVTSGEVGSMGSFEYLVYFNVLEGVAAQFGLKLVTDYGDFELDELFEQADLRKGFKHFAPRFPRHSDPSLTEASALNVAFVFQKTTGAPAAPPLRGGARGGSGPPQQQQAQQKRKADWGEQRQQQQGPGGDRGKEPRLEGDADGNAPPPATAAAVAGSAGGQGESQRTLGGAGPRPASQEYKRPTARRRTDSQAQQ